MMFSRSFSIPLLIGLVNLRMILDLGSPAKDRDDHALFSISVLYLYTSFHLQIIRLCVT